jgi:Protein of unknown function (DUF1681)
MLPAYQQEPNQAIYVFLIVVVLLHFCSGELFAQCPVDSYPSAAVEQVLDSSRYFVLRIQDGSGKIEYNSFANIRS